MLDIAQLNRNLENCEKIYSRCESVDQKQLMLKLALLETCGWLEQCLDSLYKEIIVDEHYENKRNDYIDHIYCFNADSIQKALIYSIGIVNYAQLEQSLDRELWKRTKSSLGNLKVARDRFAHTSYMSDQAYLGFSQIKSQINIIVQGLRQIRAYLVANQFIL